MRCMSLLLLTAALGACTTGPEPARTAEAAAHLDRLIAGKVAARPLTCLPHYRANDMIVIDNGTVVFKNGRTVYRNDFQGGGCSNLGKGNYALVTRTTGSGLCSGDIAEVRDVSAGITVGSCVLGDFIPYSPPRG